MKTVPTKPSKSSDAELIDGYLASMQWANRSPNTIAIRRCYLTKLSRELGPFAKIKAPVLQAWLGDPDRNLNPGTVALYLTTYSGLFTWAKKKKLLKKNPAAKIEKPQATDSERFPIPDEDLEKAFTFADERTACWLALGAYAGCRAQEIALMSREDIHDDASMRLHIIHGKGRKQRWVPLSPQLLDILNAWGELPTSGRLWPHNPQQMSRAINDHLHGACDIVESSAHSLRHFYATKLYQATKDIRLTQLLLGHSSIQTTTRYAKADMSIAAEAVIQAFAPKVTPIEIEEAA